MDDHVPYPTRIVVDANTIVAATLSDGITRELLLTTEDDLYAPGFLREEIEKYEPMLEERSGFSKVELNTLLERLFRRVEFLSTERTTGIRVRRSARWKPSIRTTRFMSPRRSNSMRRSGVWTKGSVSKLPCLTSRTR
jgi:hypothetical protein